MTSPPISHNCKNCNKENLFMEGEPLKYKCGKCKKINKIYYLLNWRLFTRIIKEE